jgi:hypothetical protein
MSNLLFAKIYYDMVYYLSSAQQLMKNPEELAEFSGKEIADGCIEIVAHKPIGSRWNRYFPNQQNAARSWLRHKKKNTGDTLEDWFGQFDSSVLPPQRDRPRIL